MKPWKFIKNGMIVTHDESQVIGIFHAAREFDSTQRDRIRQNITHLPCHLEALKSLIGLFEEDEHGEPLHLWLNPEHIAERVDFAKKALNGELSS